MKKGTDLLFLSPSFYPFTGELIARCLLTVAPVSSPDVEEQGSEKDAGHQPHRYIESYH